MKFKKHLAAIALCLSSIAPASATVLHETDGNVNVWVNLIGNINNFTLAMFDDSVVNGLGTQHLETADKLNITYNQVISFYPTTGGFLAQSPENAQPLTLTGNSHFVFALRDNLGNWALDNGYTSLGADGVELYFSHGAENSVESNVILGDVQVVPVPAAAWLFASGFLSLMALRRRKH